MRQVKVITLGFQIGRGLLVHPDHPLAKNSTIVPEDLAHEVVLRFPQQNDDPRRRKRG